MHQEEGTADANFLGGNVLGMLIEQQGDHCGWSGVGGQGRGEGTVGDRSRALIIKGFDKILGFCSKHEQGGD